MNNIDDLIKSYNELENLVFEHLKKYSELYSDWKSIEFIGDIRENEVEVVGVLDNEVVAEYIPIDHLKNPKLAEKAIEELRARKEREKDRKRERHLKRLKDLVEKSQKEIKELESENNI